MNQTLSKRLRGQAFLGVAVIFFTFGAAANACSFGTGTGARAGSLANIGRAEAESQKPEPNANFPILFPGAIQGLWQVTFSSGGQTVDLAFEVFHSDGTEMLNDITPPAEGNVCLGLWVQTSPNGYSITHPSWVFDPSGNLTDTALFKATINLVSLNKFTGSYSLAYTDLEGHPGPVYTGTMTATRITPGN